MICQIKKLRINVRTYCWRMTLIALEYKVGCMTLREITKQLLALAVFQFSSLASPFVFDVGNLELITQIKVGRGYMATGCLVKGAIMVHCSQELSSVA